MLYMNGSKMQIELKSKNIETKQQQRKQQPQQHFKHMHYLLSFFQILILMANRI